jgi:cellulose synthase/poly-beta-1,6-N-acetylglucosamine synthase-like glycosyltransferase
MLLDFLLYAVSIVVATPLVVFAAECLAALPPSRRKPKSERPPARVGVLVPAHNEEQDLGRTLGLIRAQLLPNDRVLVVADNCTDHTAQIARASGCESFERVDLERRGKGHALAAGLERMMSHEAPDVVVFFDADSVPRPGLVDALAADAIRTKRPIQSKYLFEVPPNATSRHQISALAILFKNRIRLIGLSRLGGACHITGTGFALPAELARPEFFASSHLTEDMELGLRLTSLGRPPLYRDDVEVTGILPTGDRASKSQRTRWEHGHISLLLHRGPQLLFQGIRTLRWNSVALALDLLVPPLSLLFLMAGVAVIFALLVMIFDSYRAPLSIILGSTALAMLGFLLAWARFGQKILTTRELVKIPLYVLWKLPVYLRFLSKPEKHWIRTERDPVAASERPQPERST